MVSLFFYRRDKCNKFSKNITFDSFLKNPSLSSSSKQIDFITDRKKNNIADFVGRFENLQQDFDFICDRIQIPRQKLPHKNKTQHRHYTQYYNEERKEIVRNVFSEDIALFNYEF